MTAASDPSATRSRARPRKRRWPTTTWWSGSRARPAHPNEDKAEDELEPLEGGAETLADLDEEGGQANRPGTERPPV